MALNESLPIYKSAYNLLLDTYKYLNNMPRDIRYTLLESLKIELTQLLVMICKANKNHNKLPILEEASDSLISIKVKYRLLKDMHYIDTRHYALLALNIESLSKQLSSWTAYTRNHQYSPK